MNHPKILHIINSLHTGGAETMLYKLLATADHSLFEHIVLTLIDKGPISLRVKELGVPVYTLDMKIGHPELGSWRRLFKLVQSLRPNLIQGWMYHGNWASLVAKSTVSYHPPVLWNIRHSFTQLSDERPLTHLLIRASASLSKYTDRIIYNAKVSAPQHESIGYSAIKRRVIPNGFDTMRFQPSQTAKEKTRRMLGISTECLVIGLIARYHPMKAHRNFLIAAKELLNWYPETQFILIGRDVTVDNQTLNEKLCSLGIKQSFHLLGERTDIPELMASLNIATSTSVNGEGFPNVIGEAMACGIPCVVTDVGDSAWIVDRTGIVVPPNDPIAIANGWRQLINIGQEKRAQLGQMARQRIIENFSLEQITKQYENLYQEVLNNRLIK